ncbi:MAG: hypothetical protein K2Y51_03580 [Gammaproteobacteria bacterium]|jgi:hypothetical protein|nr:hypothetical protein [Gammaproteobacteria bacterium]
MLNSSRIEETAIGSAYPRAASRPISFGATGIQLDPASFETQASIELSGAGAETPDGTMTTAGLPSQRNSRTSSAEATSGGNEASMSPGNAPGLIQYIDRIVSTSLEIGALNQAHTQVMIECGLELPLRRS